MVCRLGCGFRASSAPAGPAGLVRHASGVAAAKADYERDRQDGLMRALPDPQGGPRVSVSKWWIEHHRKINEGDSMARIIVTTDPPTQHAAPVLLDESVYSIHLDNDHNAAQLIERLGWAITDAENTQRAELALNR